MLITLADCKTFLGITDNTKDTVLTMILNMVSSYVESQTNRLFGSASYTELIDGSGTNQIKLKNFPVITFTKLEQNNSFDSSANWADIDSDDYWVDKNEGIITKTSEFDGFDTADDVEEALSGNTFSFGKQRYRATYTAGYTVIPYDIQYATASLAGQILNNRGASGLKSESLGDHSITFQDIADTANTGIFNDILNKYRDIPLA